MVVWHQQPLVILFFTRVTFCQQTRQGRGLTYSGSQFARPVGGVMWTVFSRVVRAARAAVWVTMAALTLLLSAVAASGILNSLGKRVRPEPW